MEDRDMFVTLVDENDKEVLFDLVLTFDYEGKRYAALIPVEQVEGVAEDEVVILEVVKENGEETYRSIDNEILLDEVFNEFMELFDELDDDDDEE
ncbi:MAG: DUF1292 domain-containing protein [Eubacteriales bacterium]|nr:DUF1292 domain-containing protein [Eubacteriales bacterium]